MASCKWASYFSTLLTSFPKQITFSLNNSGNVPVGHCGLHEQRDLRIKKSAGAS
uniref:Uncharacterized protein n=1 Tax=Anguilla anguilla TaxID=7936 RepID=A0A0E9WSV2_ANGAN